MEKEIRKPIRKTARIVLWCVFVVYCFVVVKLLFNRGSMGDYSVGEYFRHFSNFVPFRTVADYIRRWQNGFGELAVRNLLGNLLLFLPMGAALPLLFRRINRFWKLCVTVLGIIILAELMQGLLRVGSIDIDDVIFNLSGAMLGYPISKIPPLQRLLGRA